MAVLQKSLFFGPGKVNAKVAADTLFKTSCKGAAISKNSDTHEEEATSAKSVDLETSNWMHVVCVLWTPQIMSFVLWTLQTSLISEPTKGIQR
jgi:hypothetical protein